MEMNEYLKKEFKVSDSVLSIVDKAEKSVEEQFKRIDEICRINQIRVMKAFSDNRVSEAHFGATTGYGYDDFGRDTLDKVYAEVFGAEDALVRFNFISGTHTISTALFGVLRPGDLLISATGKPYDTLEEVIGIAGTTGNGSLKDYGVDYKQIDLLADGTADFDSIKAILESSKVKAALIQRSKGYGDRPSYSADEVGKIASFVKSISPDTVVIVDNCYGEFVNTHEPTACGADLIAGSLIKNPGGGLAKTGGYIAGKKSLWSFAHIG